MIVDAAGKPYEAAPEEEPAEEPLKCRRCDGAGELTVRRALGNWWRLICSCGEVVKAGRGDVPPMGDA